MRSTLKTQTRWWLAAMAGLCLAAGAAQARNKAQERERAQQERVQCEEQCAQASEEKAQKCIERCPLPRGGNSDAFQACSQRCIRESANDNCAQRCDPESKDTKSHTPH
jgi:hypothetical protein